MNVAFLGASKIAQKILPAIRRENEFKIIGVSSESTERGNLFAHENSIPFLGSYSDCLRNENVNAIYISAFNNKHFELVKMALDANKHVLCEKPLCLKESEAKGLFELASSKKLILMEGLMYRHHPQIKEVLAIVESKTFGSPVRFRGSFCFDYSGNESAKRRFENGGGTTADLGCYLIDFANLMANSEVSEIQKLVQIGSLGEGDKAFSAIIKFKNGFIAELSSSTTSPSLNQWEVICERGSISVFRHNPHESSSSDLYLVNEDSELTVKKIRPEGTGLDQFKNEFINFARSIAKSEMPTVSAFDSIRNAAVLENLLR